MIQLVAQIVEDVSGVSAESSKEAEDSEPPPEWSAQRTANAIYLFQVIRTLVSPTNSNHADVAAAQKTMYQCGRSKIILVRGGLWRWLERQDCFAKDSTLEERECFAEKCIAFNAGVVGK